MKRKFGFTLVELLVVIGIIALLIGILLPALSRAREQASSIVCSSQLRQIGMAAQQYAVQYKGFFPPQHQVPGNATLEKFMENISGNGNQTADNFDPDSVRDAMARCLNVKVPVFPSPTGNYVSPSVPVLYCPVALALGQRMTGNGIGTYNAQPENFLAKGTGNGQAEGKFLYWWVANPFDCASCDFGLSGAPGTYAGNPDLAAAQSYAHMETGKPVFDANRPCRPGIDYLRRTSDKNADKVAICVDQSRQQAAGWFWMHGDGRTNPQRGWKNELMGDGHVDLKHPTECVSHWSSTSPAAW